MLRTGKLFDITKTARMTEIYMPASLTPKLWRNIADTDQFRPNDPRVISLCWTVFLMLLTRAYRREHQNDWSRTLWFEANILGRTVNVKAMAHPGNNFEPTMTLMSPEEGCDFVK